MVSPIVPSYGPLTTRRLHQNVGIWNWLNQQRLADAEQSSFLVWFENHGEAVAIGPAMPRGTGSTAVTELKTLLSWMI
ncbi:MAG: hypothetical protein ACHP8A_18325 [Terriglobales bacterium]